MLSRSGWRYLTKNTLPRHSNAPSTLVQLVRSHRERAACRLLPYTIRANMSQANGEQHSAAVAASTSTSSHAPHPVHSSAEPAAPAPGKAVERRKGNTEQKKSAKKGADDLARNMQALEVSRYSTSPCQISDIVVDPPSCGHTGLPRTSEPPFFPSRVMRNRVATNSSSRSPTSFSTESTCSTDLRPSAMKRSAVRYSRSSAGPGA